MKRFSLLTLSIGVLLIGVCLLIVTPQLSLAAGPSAGTSKGSVKDVRQDVLLLGNDVVSAGNAIDLNSPTAKANLMAAGQSVFVSGGSIGADAFVAGNKVTLKETNVKNNAFLAGQKVVTHAVVEGIVFAAGNEVVLGGEGVSASVAGNKVTISGSYSEDVNVSANEVVIEPSAVVRGRLNVTASQEPSIPSGAQINDITFTQNNSGRNAAAGLATLLVSLRVFMLVVGFVGTIVLALLFLLVATPKPFENAANALAKEPARILLTGLAVMVIAPIVAIILVFTIIGFEAGMILLLVIGVLSLACDVFSALSVGFLVFKKMNRWGAGILMTLIFAAVGAIPILGILLGLFCGMYMAGYVFTTYLDWRRAAKQEAAARKQMSAGYQQPVGESRQPVGQPWQSADAPQGQPQAMSPEWQPQVTTPIEPQATAPQPTTEPPVTPQPPQGGAEPPATSASPASSE